MSLSLTPAPALAHVLADLAHDWRMRAYNGDLIITPDEAETYAKSFCDLAASAKLMFETFDRLVRERDQLLAIAEDADLIAFAKRGAPAPVRDGNVIDLTELFARERSPNQTDGAA